MQFVCLDSSLLKNAAALISHSRTNNAFLKNNYLETLGIHFSGHEDNRSSQLSNLLLLAVFLLAFICPVFTVATHTVCVNLARRVTPPRAFWPRTEYLPKLTAGQPHDIKEYSVDSNVQQNICASCHIIPFSISS